MSREIVHLSFSASPVTEIRGTFSRMKNNGFVALMHCTHPENVSTLETASASGMTHNDCPKDFRKLKKTEKHNKHKAEAKILFPPKSQ